MSKKTIQHHFVDKIYNKTEINDMNVGQMWFQDGATCHTATETIRLLHETFNDHVIYKRGNVN